VTLGIRVALLPAAASCVKTMYPGRQCPPGSTATRFGSSGIYLALLLEGRVVAYNAAVERFRAWVN